MRVWVAGVYGAKSSEQLAAALSGRGMDSRLFSLDECTLDLERNTVLWKGADLSDLEGIAVRKLGDPVDVRSHQRINLLCVLASRGIRIFSRPEAIELANNRYSNTLRLRQAGVPVPATIVTESIDEAIARVCCWGKAVLKPLHTSKGRGMLLLDAETVSRQQLLDWQATWPYPFYLQEYVSGISDTGVAFLGGSYIGAFNRIAGHGSWQTTIRTGGHYAPASLSSEVIGLAKKAADAFGLDYTVVDVVSDGERYMVYEVSPFGGFAGLSVAGIDAAGLLARYIDNELAAIKK